jgi:hypothetical protein
MKKLLLTAVLGAVVAAVLGVSMTASAARGCPVCGKNLIKNPGAEAGAGITAVDAFGAVPGWTIEAGQFGAASYAFPNGWFSARSKAPAKRGKNYFFGGTTTAAVEASASIGRQTIKLPAAAVGRKATLSGWLGNYVQNRAQVRAEFMNASGAVLSTLKIGPDTTISGTDMALRSRSKKVPAKTTQVSVVVSFAGGGAAYKLAGADNLSLVLS